MDGPALVFASTAAGRGDPASPARRWLPLAVAASLVVVLAELFLSHAPAAALHRSPAAPAATAGRSAAPATSRPIAGPRGRLGPLRSVETIAALPTSADEHGTPSPLWTLPGPAIAAATAISAAAATTIASLLRRPRPCGDSPAGALASSVLLASSLAAACLDVPAAHAFPNAVPEAAQYRSEPKTPGKAPEGIGMLKRPELDGDIGLKPCGTTMKCFSSTPRVPERDENFIPPWTPPAGMSGTEGLAQLREVVERYPPGQGGIDGGGFQVIKSEPDYLYLQFEALQNGNIDDVEFGVEGNQVTVRSASREGFIDQGKNCLRLNWISAELRKLGWKAAEISQLDHPRYFFANYEFILRDKEIAGVKAQQRMGDFVFEDFRIRAKKAEEKLPPPVAP